MLSSAPFDALTVVAHERSRRLLTEGTADPLHAPSRTWRALGVTLRRFADRLDPPTLAPLPSLAEAERRFGAAPLSPQR